MAEMGEDTGHTPLSYMAEEVKSFEITVDAFDRVLVNPEVIACLYDLDISPEDHIGLFDILDSDKGGTMLFGELLAGIEKLRGEPRRSDLVSVDLMLREVQKNVSVIRTVHQR